MCGAGVQCPLLLAALQLHSLCFLRRQRGVELAGVFWNLNRGGSQCGPRAPKCPRILAWRSARLFLSSCYYKLEGMKCFLN